MTTKRLEVFSSLADVSRNRRNSKKVNAYPFDVESIMEFTESLSKSY